MIVIRLKDFLRTGLLGTVSLGMIPAQVEERLGRAPNLPRSSSSCDLAFYPWRYGDLSLDFEPFGRTLSLINLTGFDVPHGGGRVRLEPGFVNGMLSCSQTEGHLRAAAISYRKQDWPLHANGIRLTTESNVVLSCSHENPERVCLRSVRRSALFL